MTDPAGGAFVRPSVPYTWVTPPISVDRPSVGDATKYVVPSGDFAVKGDGVSDDSAALHALCHGVISPDGGTLTLQGPHTYSVNSDVTIPANVTLRVLHGARLKLGAGVTLTVRGPLEAPIKKIFDCSASGSLVLMPGKTVFPEWWGAAADGTTNNSPYIQLAFDALQETGGTVRFTDDTGIYCIADRILFQGTQYTKFAIEGNGWHTRIKHTVDWAYELFPDGHCGLFNLLGGNDNNRLDNFIVRDIRISGNSINDHCEIFRLSYVRRGFFDRLYMDTNGLEGICCINTLAAELIEVRGCYAEAIGRSTTWTVSAYNTNADHCTIVDSFAVDCGFAVEHTGRGLICTGNQFLRSRGQRSVMVFSTSYPNEVGVVANNVITDCNTGIEVADQGNSIGKLIISGNSLTNVAQGINIGAVAGEGVLVEGNVITGGYHATATGSAAATGAAIFVGHGRHIVRGNVIKRSWQTTTGSSVDANVLQVPTGTGITAGMELSISGVSGLFTVERTVFGFPTALYVVLSSNIGSTVSGATITYRHKQFAYGIQAVNDQSIIQDNSFIGNVALTSLIRLQGALPILRNNSIQEPGSAMKIVTIQGTQGGLSGAPTTLLESDYRYQTPLIYSNSDRSEITCANDPPALTWKVGDICWTPSPTAGGMMGKVCTTAGTAGTLTDAITVSGSAGSDTVTANTSLLWLLYVGCWITISGVSGAKRIIEISGSTIRLHAPIGSSVSGAAVSYSAPVWSSFGEIAA